MPDNMPAQPNFPVIRKGGVDPASVESYLEEFRRYFEQRVATAEARYSNLELELEEARKREEAVHLTLVAATKTKEELLVNAQREADDMVAGSRSQAEELLAEAKKEAFRMVSEARESAESAAGEARTEAARIAAEATESAEATRDAARREAIEMINTVESDTAALMAAQETAVADMRRKYEEEEAELAARVEVLRATAADLEARLKAIATGTLGQAGSLVTEAPAVSAPPQPAPITAAEPPTVAPKARRSIDPIAADLARVDDPGSAETARELAEPAAQVAAAGTVTADAAMESPAVVANVETVATQDLADEFTDGLMDPDDEVAGAVEPAAEAEAIGKVVEPAVEMAEVETSASDAIDEAEPDSADDLSDPFAAGGAIEGEVTAAEEAEEVIEAPQPEPVPAAVGAPLSNAADSEEGNRKGSYYSRRSAKLPRIGTEAGRSALAAANAIRGATRGTSAEPTDVTAQSA